MFFLYVAISACLFLFAFLILSVPILLHNEHYILFKGSN